MLRLLPFPTHKVVVSSVSVSLGMGAPHEAPGKRRAYPRGGIKITQFVVCPRGGIEIPQFVVVLSFILLGLVN